MPIDIILMRAEVLSNGAEINRQCPPCLRLISNGTSVGVSLDSGAAARTAAHHVVLLRSVRFRSGSY